MAITPDEIREAVGNSIDTFIKDEAELLDVDASERSLTHKFAEHLKEQFKGYHVDCEYNRRGYDVKRLKGISPPRKPEPDDADSITFFPDIIVHRRKVDEDNVLVVEAKKSNNKDGHDFDIKKLERLTRDPEYAYQFGLFIIFDVDKRTISELQWFRNGEQIA